MKSVCIGIHVHAEPERLHATLASVRAHTPAGFELWLLPDGPDGPTRAALAGLGDRPQSATDEPRGAAACFNRLVTSTSADVWVLLESGSLVGPGWLDYLLAALDADARHGLAGPSTNRVWNEQGVFPRASGDPQGIVDTAREAARRFGAAWRTLEPLYSLADFCYVVRRDVVDAIGAADEGYGLGPCWEMDYNLRAARAGWRGVWACGAYVYRAPFTARRRQEEARYFDASKQRYQAKFCARQLRRESAAYEPHCRGEACEHFAPAGLIQIRRPFAAPASALPPEPAALTPRAVAPPAPDALPTAPLVTCIMPTYNRRAFIPRAIRGFLQQDYPNLELIVVDDGDDPVGDLVPQEDRFQVIRLARRHSVGAKRNLACQHARGEIIVHWDDDDWYPAWRVRVQARALLEGGADVCGSSQVYYYEPGADRAWRYDYGGQSPVWVAGNTLAYRRELWRRNPFPDIQVGEDSRFLWSAASKQVHDLRDPSLCIGMIHAANVSPKDTRGVHWHAQPAEAIYQLLGGDLHLYRAEARPSPPSPVPLVSCIMPTYNRRAFMPLTLQMFAQQDYPAKELLVLDDGSDPVGDLVEKVPGARYLRLGQRTSIGAKRNLGCQQAQGDIIVQWDDDDWYSPNRLSYQVAPIVAGQADLTGLENTYVLTLPRGEFWTIRSPLHQRMFVGDVHGGTLTLRKAILDQRVRYPEVNLAEDAGLIRLAQQQGRRLMRLANPGVFVYVRHENNTWKFEAGRFLDPSGWERTAAPPTFPADTVAAYQTAALNSQS